MLKHAQACVCAHAGMYVYDLILLNRDEITQYHIFPVCADNTVGYSIPCPVGNTENSPCIFNSLAHLLAFEARKYAQF